MARPAQERAAERWRGRGAVSFGDEVGSGAEEIGGGCSGGFCLQLGDHSVNRLEALGYALTI
jgi:hypothetical protein